MKKCVIVGAGTCDVQQLGKRLILNDKDLCIAADGGLDYLLKNNITPDIILGDMDSLNEPDLLKTMEESDSSICIKRLPVEKDDTDMLAAIKEGLAAGYQRFELYGAFGGRFDHTFANVQCLLYLLNHDARGIIAGDDVTLILIRDERITFHADDASKGKRISVFAFGGDAYGVSEKGLKYVLNHVTVKQEFPIGVSNEFMGEDAEIEVQNGMLLICVEV
ncbi:MAG: thiamine diphosphokinase [Lachnospiraceae bacterium]|nr:thiamine diphosphokinase [Lachnospiraceae bacterium]